MKENTMKLTLSLLLILYPLSYNLAFAHNGMTPEKMRAQLLAEGAIPNQASAHNSTNRPPQVQNIQTKSKATIKPQMRNSTQNNRYKSSNH